MNRKLTAIFVALLLVFGWVFVTPETDLEWALATVATFVGFAAIGMSLSD